jgi:hypothetical protein
MVTYLFEVFMFDCDVVEGDDEDGVAVFELSGLLIFRPGHQLVLNKDKCFHGVMKGQLMLVHLRQNRADIKVYLAWVGYLEAFINLQPRGVDAGVLQIQRLLQVL